jgi:TP901 family phage tail tape measure protein
MARADVMAGRAYVSLYTKGDALTRGLQKAKDELNHFGSQLLTIGSSVIAGTAAIAAPIAFATKTFAGFDDAMRAVGAVSRATDAELKLMTKTAEHLGETTSFTAVQVAALMTELGRAGFKPEQINAMTSAVMNLARATGTDSTRASQIMAASIRQFGLDATHAARVADVLTTAANSTFNSVESLGESLKFAGPVAKSLGLSLEDTVAILGTLGNVGIQGSEAGTALRRLSVISAATGAKLKETFGISNVDAAGRMKPLVQILGEIGVVVDKLPVTERVEKMNAAFGLLGITSATVLSGTAGDTRALADELRNAGGAADATAKKMDAGLGGTFRIIASAAEGLEMALGEALAGSLQGITKSITHLIGVATHWVKNSPELINVFATITAAVGAAGVALVLYGIRMKATAALVSAVSVVYQVAASAAAAAWYAVGVAFTVLTIKARINSAIIKTVWTASTTAISLAFKSLSAVMGAAFATTVLVASASVIVAVWLGAAATISVAVFGLGTVLSATSAVATAAWSAAGGVITGTWLAAAGTIGAAWAALSSGLTALALAATTAWAAGAGVMGTSMAVAQALAGMFGVQGSISAAIVGAAFSAAGAVSSIAWSGFLAVITSVFTMSNMLTFAALVVQAAWSAAWLAVSGPILPILAGMAAVVAIVGSIAAAAAYAAVKGADFSRAWGIVTTTLSEMLSIAKTVGGILMDAFAGGDYDLAFRAAMAGIKLTLASALDGIAKLWSEFWSGAWRMTKAFFANFAAISWRIVKAIANAIANPFQAAQEIKSALSDLVSGKSTISLSLDTSSMRSQARAEIAAIEKELEERKTKRDAEAEAKQKAEEQAAQDTANDGADASTDTAVAQKAEQEAELTKEAQKAAEAFKRETEALEQQLIALREGADAAERFRLAKKGLSEDQIDAVMALRAEQEELEKQKEKSEGFVKRIQDFADVGGKANKLSSDEIMKREKELIADGRKRGLIDEETAKNALAEAEVRKAERDHQEKLKQLRGDDDKKSKDKDKSGIKAGAASAATFSARSLVSMGSGAGQNPQVQQLMLTKKAIIDQTKLHKELSEKQIAAIKQSKMKHA